MRVRPSLDVFGDLLRREAPKKFSEAYFYLVIVLFCNKIFSVNTKSKKIFLKLDYFGPKRAKLVLTLN